MGGAVPLHKPFFPPCAPTHSSPASLPWISPLLVEWHCCCSVRSCVSIYPSCFLPPENSNTNQQLTSKQRCDTQVQPHGPQIRCNSEEPLFAAVTGHDFPRLSNTEGAGLLFISPQTHRISRICTRFTALTLLHVDANGGGWWCECSSPPLKRPLPAVRPSF